MHRDEITILWFSQVLVNHYERCGLYYGSGGSSMFGSATEEEKRLTMMLFSGIFDSLAQRVRNVATVCFTEDVELEGLQHNPKTI
jgi:hypothetical protein